MAAVETSPPRDKLKGRKASKEVRQAQLIEATIDVLYRRGYADTTLADVADSAGLSRGIVNFHFNSKDELLLATLKFLTDEYSAHWRKAIARAEPDAGSQLWALVASDFDRAVASRRKLAAWSAFVGEAKTRPAYRDYCGQRDSQFADTLVDLCRRLGGDRDADPEKLALSLEAMLWGLWNRMLLTNMELSREKAHSAAIEALIVLFPGRFDRNGPVPAGEIKAR
ncbi:MAG: TetR/AcrR family transcriptional regulator [Pseudomonadota bacterium]